MMLIPLIVLVSSLVVLFVAVSFIFAIWRLASKNNQGVGVLRKDRYAQGENEHEEINGGSRATSIFDSDEDMIGGSPLHLPHPIGPTGTFFNFHVYAPPSVDKEIPKIDLVGTLDFLTTGRVRKFVPVGAKRLLVLNLQEMTLEVYVPKRGRKYKKKKKKKNSVVQKKNKKEGVDSSIASFSDGTSKTSTILKPTGINISTKQLDIEDDAKEEEDTDDVEFEADDEEEVWSPRHFEATPKTVLKLDDLISVSALSPNRYGGVIEILSCSPKMEEPKLSVSMGKEKEIATTAGKLTQTVKETEPPPQKSLKPFRSPPLQLSETREDLLLGAAEMEEWWRGSDATPVARNGTLASTKREMNENGDKIFEESIIVGAAIDETTTDAGEINTVPTEVCNDEFVFRTPRDAAEFQRIVMALRTSGRDIQQLFEALETIQANTDAHFPTAEEQVINAKKRLKNNNTAKEVPRFVSPGVALDDAWRCLNDITVVNVGLRQYRLYSLSDKDDDIIAAAASSDKNAESKEGTKKESGSSNEENDEETQKRKELYEHYLHRRTILGLRDFFSLFVPPLPIDSPAVPHFSPCVATESSLERDCKFSGVEVHRLRLRLASALQLRVGSAAIYVRAYSRAKVVVQEGWCLALDLIDQEHSFVEEGTPDKDDVKSDTDTKEGHSRISQKMARLTYDNERENLIRDVGVQNEYYEPAVCPSQGYQLVGWHSFEIPTSEREQFWLRPEKDPIETFPSLKQIVARHSDLHFVVVSYYNEQVNMVTYFLLVRSLPVGIDESFDDTMNNFINSSAKERDKRFELRLSVAPGHSWSSLAKAAIQFVTVALCGGRKVNTLGPERNSRISFPGVLVSNVMKLNHFGGSLREKGSLSNYVALNAHLTKPTGILLRQITVRKCSIDYAVAVNADNAPGRVLGIIRMVNMCWGGIPSTYAPISLESETVVDDASASDHEIESTCDTSVWGRIFRFGTPAKKPSRGSAAGENQDELYSEEIDIIYDILDGVRVPARKGDRNENELVRLNLTRSDIERFVIACECDLNAAVARIIKSQTWRFCTFPVDQRLCRVELESGQFTHQGKDKQNNPIFCFRNSLSTPWAGNVKSTMMMILHRLETFFSSRNGIGKVTVILLTGCSKEEIDCASDKSSRKKKVAAPSQDGEAQPAGSSADKENDIDVQAPEIDATTADYHIHSNFQLVKQMYELLSFHYPERLNKALIVPSKAFPKRRISSFALSPITQTRVVVLNTQAELKKYVAESELKKLGL